MHDTREDMLSAAAEELLEHGYAGTTMASIAGRLGLTKGALAHHFPTKAVFAEALGDELRTAIGATRDRAEDLFPHSGSRAMVAFLLALGGRSTSDARVAAAVSLIADRAAPSAALGRAFEDLRETVAALAARAQADGELGTRIAAADVAEYLLMTNLGTAFLARHTHDPERGPRRLRFVQLTLETCGMPNADAVVADVLARLASDSTSG